MIAPTHIAFAEFVYLLILTTTGIALSPLNAIVVGVAALLPDVDTQASTVGKVLRVISGPIERRFGHRTLTHSVFGVGIVAAVLSPLLLSGSPFELYVCFLAGYASHPFLDTMTINGVQLFYPFSRHRCVFPLEVNQPQRYRMRTGSRLDKALAVIFLLACVPVWFIAHEGHKRIIRVAQQSIESAVRDYNEFSRTHRVVADVAAHNLLTKEWIDGTYEVIGSLNDHTLLFRGSDSLVHSLGKEYHAEYAADNVLCRRGASILTFVETVDMANRPLSQLALYLQQGGEHQLFGTLTTDTPVLLDPFGDGFLSIRSSSRTLHFNHASYSDIRRLGLEQLFITGGSIILRTITNDSVPAPAARIPTEFIRTSVEASSSDSVQIVCQEGDTVGPGMMLVRFVGVGLQSRRQEILRRQQLEQHRYDTRMKEFSARISDLMTQMHQESLTVVRLESWQKGGYVSAGTIMSHRKSIDRTRAKVTVLIKKRTALEQAHHLSVGKYASQLEGLREKEKELLRSPVSGIIHEIRDAVHKQKRLITVTVRKR